MSSENLKAYRFSTPQQWGGCLLAHVNQEQLRSSGTIGPIVPFANVPTRYASDGAHAPVVTRTGDILWRDNQEMLYRLTDCSDEPRTGPAPHSLSHASRVTATPGELWVMGQSLNTIERLEDDSLTLLLTIELPQLQVVDIAAGQHGGVLVLVEQAGTWQIIPVNQHGRTADPIALNGISQARAFCHLRDSGKFVVLTDEQQPRLCWFAAAGGGPLLSLSVAGLAPCFEADALGSDSARRIFLAGTTGPDFGSQACVIEFDSDGNQAGEVPIDSADAPVTGVFGIADALLVTGRQGLLRFDRAEPVPLDGGQVECMVLTPALFARDREDQRRWLRIEALGYLPAGTTLEIAWAATDDPEFRDHFDEIVAKDSAPASQRISALLSESGLRHGNTVFHGAENASAARKFAAKLFDVKERYVWVCAILTAIPGSRLPSLKEIQVLYFGRTLMEDLPAIYQREEQRPGSYLRSLVGVLETTTQGLDAQINGLGRQIHPATAPEPWLDFVARWLGVPWDDALSISQKRLIVMRAQDLAGSRGTRAGLETLLECLIPGKPRRFRVIDSTADYGFAIVGGQASAGSRLPAMLGGHTRWHSELGLNAVLGTMRLPCAGQLDDGVWQITGKIRVDVAATGSDRAAWDPWLLNLISEMIPLSARVELRWVAPQSLRSRQLDGTLTLEPDSSPHLGTDAITSRTRLPEGKIRISATGPTIETRLS